MKLMRISTRPLQGDRVCIRGSKYSLTLVSLIIVQQTLLIFHNPTYTFTKFYDFKANTIIYCNKFPKISTCTALFHPALLLIFKILPSCTFIPNCTINWETKVFRSQIEDHRICQLGSLADSAQSSPYHLSCLLTLVFLIWKHACNKIFLMIFQPARPFLLHKNKQGGKLYLVNLVPLLAYYILLAY